MVRQRRQSLVSRAAVHNRLIDGWSALERDVLHRPWFHLHPRNHSLRMILEWRLIAGLTCPNEHFSAVGGKRRQRLAAWKYSQTPFRRLSCMGTNHCSAKTLVAGAQSSVSGMLHTFISPRGVTGRNYSQGLGRACGTARSAATVRGRHRAAAEIEGARQQLRHHVADADHADELALRILHVHTARGSREAAAERWWRIPTHPARHSLQ